MFIISTYADGKPPESAEWFCKWLEEASNDFRVQKSLLSGLDYAVFGLGNSLYKERFNMVSIKGNNFHSIVIIEFGLRKTEKLIVEVVFNKHEPFAGRKGC